MKLYYIILFALTISILIPHDLLSQWVTQNSGTTVNLNSVFILDSAKAIVVGDSGIVLKTTDSGKNWISVNTGIKNNLRDLAFYNLYPDTYGGVVVGDSVIATTTNLGESWSIKKMPYRFTSCNYVILVVFPLILAGDDNGRLFIEDGSEWLDTLLLPGEKIASLGSDYHTPALSYANVTGASAYHTFRTLFPNDKWNITQNPVGHYDYIYGGDLSNFPQYLIGETGHLIPEPVYWKNDLTDTTWVLPNDSIPWTRYSGIFPDKYFSLRGVDAYKSFAAMCGSKGIIIRSYNEGNDWSFDSTGTKETLNSIKFYGTETGFCVGDNGTILHYSATISNIADRMPYKFILYQNYPNPFNPVTTISYSIPSQSFVELKIYDMLGREVETLVNKELSAGEYNVQFNASSLPSGVYVYSLKAGKYNSSRKLVLLK